MVVDLQLAGENKEDIDLNVTKHLLDLRSPCYRLSLPLPHPVDPDSSTADWHTDKAVLTISLPLKREMDFANF